MNWSTAIATGFLNHDRIGDFDTGRHFLLETKRQARIAVAGADLDLALDRLFGQRAAAERRRKHQHLQDGKDRQRATAEHRPRPQALARAGLHRAEWGCRHAAVPAGDSAGPDSLKFGV